MQIVNYHNRKDGEGKFLYKIRYESWRTQDDRDVYILATDVDDALDIFNSFNETGAPNPEEIKEVDKERRKVANKRIKELKCLDSAVLSRSE